MLEEMKEVLEVTGGLDLNQLYFLMWWHFSKRKMFIISFLRKNGG